MPIHRECRRNSCVPCAPTAYARIKSRAPPRACTPTSKPRSTYATAGSVTSKDTMSLTHASTRTRATIVFAPSRARRPPYNVQQSVAMTVRVVRLTARRLQARRRRLRPCRLTACRRRHASHATPTRLPRHKARQAHHEFAQVSTMIMTFCDANCRIVVAIVFIDFVVVVLLLLLLLLLF